MAVPNHVANLMLSDLVELHRARINLHQAYDAIATTGMQGKPAILGSLDQADDVLLEMIEKGAKRALYLMQTRRGMRTRTPASFIDLIQQLVERMEHETTPVASAAPAAPIKFITAGRNGTEGK